MTIPADQLRLLPGRESGTRRYGILLLILVVTYLLSAFTVADLVSAVQVLLFLAVVLIALHNGRLRRKTTRAVGVGLVLGSVAAAILQAVDHNGLGAGVASLWTAMILLLAVFFIVRQVLAQPEITLQSIFGVLSAYMMIGLIFSAVYVAMWRFSGQSFFAGGSQDNPKTFQYFSFTTLTTLGYGDFTAASGRGTGSRRAGGHGRPDVPGHPGGPAGGRIPLVGTPATRQGRRQVAPAVGQGSESSGAGPGSGPDALRAVAVAASPDSGDAAAGQPSLSQPSPGHPGPGPASARRSSPGPSRAKQASAPGLVRLSPPGAVRGRGTGVRRGGRNEAGRSGPASAARPSERT